jgi:hypothetical protein
MKEQVEELQTLTSQRDPKNREELSTLAANHKGAPPSPFMISRQIQ